MSAEVRSPGPSADVEALDRLRSLRLPPLGGLRFLDVGCGDGFFCGFASFEGSASVVGIDHDIDAVAAARQRFPEVQFLHQDWDALPEGMFDVILLASVIHHAADVSALLRNLMLRLAPGGLLVVELGVAASRRPAGVGEAKDGAEGHFPSMKALEKVFEGYAWKWIGPGVTSRHDPVVRHVVHVHHRRPMAYLLMQPPGFGKSSIARSLFANSTIPVVSGDQVLLDIAQGRLQASPELSAVVRSDFNGLAMDRATERAFGSGLAAELVGLWLQRGGGGDLAVDAFVPDAEHEHVVRLLSEIGHLPVVLSWDRPGLVPAAGAGTVTRVKTYADSLALGATARGGGHEMGFKGTIGFLDHAESVDGRLLLRGWAMHESGVMPSKLGIRSGRKMHVIDDFERQHRPDVQAHLGLPHDICGFLAVVQLADIGGLRAAESEWQLFGGPSAQDLDGPFGRHSRGPRS